MDKRVLQLSNFKGLAELQITFSQQLTVLVGANGIGKSSVLQALNILGKIGKSRPQQFADSTFDAVGGRARAQDWCRRGTNGFDIEYNFSSFRLRAEFRPIGPFPSFQLRANAIPGVRTETSQVSPETLAIENAFAEFSTVLLRPEFSSMAAAVGSPISTPSLTEFGGNLAGVLGWMALSSRKRFEQLIALLKQVVPGVDDVLIEPVQVETGPGQKFSVVFQGEAVPSVHVSEGTNITLCILAAVLGPQQAKLVLIDDLDRGLHPKAQGALVDCIRSALKQLPDIQIVCTSHSPFILEHFEADEVRVLSRTPDGVAAASLQSHPDWQKYKDVLPAGSFWSSVGDEWATK